MYRRVLPFLTIAVILACNAENSTQPPPALPSSASPVISDGAHGGVNPDFFFIPSTVPNPKNHPDYGDPFNGSLLPLVTICELAPVAPGGDGDVDEDTPCSGAYTQNFQLTAANVDLVAEKYQVDWTVPVAAAVYYRISVTVGSNLLGYADVKTGPTPQALKGTDQDDFITRVDGADLPIKFRIEQYALCSVPGTGPCSSETVNLATGGTVSTTLGDDTEPTGVEIQPGSGVGTTTVTIEECLNLNPRATDLPTFGRCASVTADPPLTTELLVPAIVFICSAPADIPTTISATQKARITLHRFDEGPPAELNALPHADACNVSVGSASGSLKGMLAELVRGRFRSAGGELVAMLAPKPLFATAMLDEGGGGETDFFSDFQFALPARLRIVSGNGQTAAPGSTLPNDPTVIVEDLGTPAQSLAPEPVAGAKVTFSTTDGSATPSSFVTLADGLASTAWTLKTTPGANVLTAGGRGLAGSDFNGPRTGVDDPFQPIQAAFDGADPSGGPVKELVRNGTVTFTATGSGPEVIILNDINLLDNTGLGNAENGDFLTGVLNYTNTGPRASQTVVMFDVGRNTSLCTTGPSTPYCPAATGPGSAEFATLRAAIGGMGLTISDVSSSSLSSNTVLRSIPSNVKAIFLWMPIEGFAYDEINALKTFVGEGGRLVYIGENDGAYGPTASGGWQDGDATQDFFLSDMGSAMTRTGGAIDAGYTTLPNASLTLSPSSSAKHPVMTNVTSLTIAAAAQVALGTADATLFRNSGNTVVLGAVARISLTPISPPVVNRVMSRGASSQRATSTRALGAATSSIDATTGLPRR